MIELSLKTALPKIRQAYIDKQLGFQTGKNSGNYRYFDGSRCAIGAAMSDNEIDQIHSVTYATIYQLQDMKYVHMAITEGPVFKQLQELHDGACAPSLREEFRKEFVAYLDGLLREYGLEPLPAE